LSSASERYNFFLLVWLWIFGAKRFRALVQWLILSFVKC
jgi:hypothetical protein